MDFTLPAHLPGPLAEMDEFIEAEIKPLERANMQYFDRRREFARTDLEIGGVQARAWADLLDEMRRLTGGASRTTWAFSAGLGAHAWRLILRTGAPEEAHAGMELEARVQAPAGAAGAPVPEILAASDSVAALGSPYLICSYVAGETIVRRILRGLDDAGRAELLRQCATALAAIHHADPAGADLDSRDQLQLWRDQLDQMGDTTATFEYASRWLAANRPAPPTNPALVHGDFRMGNLIIDGCDLSAVLDWELVHSGGPCEGLAWFCIRAWRFGAPSRLGAGGLGGVEHFVAGYEHAGGGTVDRAEFRWWLIPATLRWGVICRWQGHRHLSGQSPVGGTGPHRSAGLRNGMGSAEPAGRGRRVNARYGRPTAAELVAAVADFLDHDVRAATASCPEVR